MGAWQLSFIDPNLWLQYALNSVSLGAMAIIQAYLGCVYLEQSFKFPVKISTSIRRESSPACGEVLGAGFGFDFYYGQGVSRGVGWVSIAIYFTN